MREILISFNRWTTLIAGDFESNLRLSPPPTILPPWSFLSPTFRCTLARYLIYVRKFEHQATGPRLRLEQFGLYPLAHGESEPRSISFEAMMRFIMLISVPRQGADRHEAVGAGLVEADEETEPRHATDTGCEYTADSIREEDRCEPIQRVSFGGGGASLGRGYLLADFGEALICFWRQTAFA